MKLNISGCCRIEAQGTQGSSGKSTGEGKWKRLGHFFFFFLNEDQTTGCYAEKSPGSMEELTKHLRVVFGCATPLSVAHHMQYVCSHWIYFNPKKRLPVEPVTSQTLLLQCVSLSVLWDDPIVCLSLSDTQPARALPCRQYSSPSGTFPHWLCFHSGLAERSNKIRSLLEACQKLSS